MTRQPKWLTAEEQDAWRGVVQATVPLNAERSDPGGAPLHADVTLLATITRGTKFGITVLFDDTPPMWDTVTVRGR